MGSGGGCRTWVGRASVLVLALTVAAAFTFPSSSIAAFAFDKPAQAKLRHPPLRAVQQQQHQQLQQHHAPGPVFREATTRHLSIGRIPWNVPVEDLLYMIGEPNVEKMYVTPPKKFSKRTHGGKIFLTCPDLSSAQKLLNTPPSMLGATTKTKVFIRRETCAFDETRMVHMRRLPFDCTEAMLRQVVSPFGPVTRMVLYRVRPPLLPNNSPRPRIFFNPASAALTEVAAIVVFEKPESARNMTDSQSISFQRRDVRLGLVCNDFILHPYEIIRDTPQTSKFRVNLAGIPNDLSEEQITKCFNKYGIEVTDVDIAIEAILLNGTILQNGRAHVGVRSFANVMKASFMINNQTEGFVASGESPPDGHIIPYVIRNIPADDVVSRTDWLDFFTKQGIDTIFHVETVQNQDGTRDMNVDAATLRDAPGFAKLNTTEVNGFKPQVHRRHVVQRSRFYTRARDKFCRVFGVGPFELNRLPYLFADEAGLASDGPPPLTEAPNHEPLAAQAENTTSNQSQQS